MMPRLTLSLLCLLLVLPTGCAAQAPTQTQHVELDERAFELELALTGPQRYQGLSGREHIEPQGGMLFVFPDDQVKVQQFVMRDCPVPIDIIFLDPGGRITAMHEMKVEPEGPPWVRYSSRYPAQFAIELAGGTLDDLQLRLGQRVELPRRELVERAK